MIILTIWLRYLSSKGCSRKTSNPLTFSVITVDRFTLHLITVFLIFVVISLRFLPSFPLLFPFSLIQVFSCHPSQGTSKAPLCVLILPVCLYFICSGLSWVALSLTSCFWSQWRPHDLAKWISFFILGFLLGRGNLCLCPILCFSGNSNLPEVFLPCSFYLGVVLYTKLLSYFSLFS